MAKEHVFRRAEARNEPNVVLTAREAQDAARLLKQLLKRDPNEVSSLERDVHSIDAILSSPPRSVERNATVELARRTFLARRARSRFVGGAMFGEPGWDMLLALYITEAVERQSVTTLTALSGVPATTALRWLEHLVSQGFASRRPHISDGRVSFIEITDEGRENLDTYFSALLEKGFADL